MSEVKNLSLIVGMGEVGSSIYEVLKDVYMVHRTDLEPVDELVDSYDVMHICFPYFNGFVDAVQEYKAQYNPRIVVIHSTVPVGTTKKCGDDMVHSPIRGKHPHLAESLKIFAKELGTNHEEFGNEIEEYFQKAGVPAKYLGQSSDATELAKIMSTTYYAWNIVFAKEMKRLCDKYDVDYDFAYKKWNEDYNAGYDEMDENEFSIFHRPVLKDVPGKIGGHCITSNCELDDNVITEFVKKQNDTY